MNPARHHIQHQTHKGLSHRKYHAFLRRLPIKAAADGEISVSNQWPHHHAADGLAARVKGTGAIDGVGQKWRQRDSAFQRAVVQGVDVIGPRGIVKSLRQIGYSVGELGGQVMHFARIRVQVEQHPVVQCFNFSATRLERSNLPTVPDVCAVGFQFVMLLVAL